MLSIHPEVQDFADEDEKNYETNEIDKDRWSSSAFLLLTKNWKIQNNKIRHANLVHVLSKEEQVKRSKGRTFSPVKPSWKRKMARVQTFNYYVFLMKHSVATQCKGFNGKYTDRGRL